MSPPYEPWQAAASQPLQLSDQTTTCIQGSTDQLNSGHNNTSFIMRALRPPIARTKTGCFACRKRRKKCDERRPLCKGCERNDLHCSWPVGVPSSKSAHSKRFRYGKEKLPEDAESLLPNQIEELSSSDQSSSASPINSLSPETPQAQSALQRTRYVSPPVSRQHSYEEEFLNSLNAWKVNVINTGKALKTPASRVLLDHFIHRTTTVMSIYQGEQNPFISRLLPMAIGNELIMQSILAMSGIHYAAHYSSPVGKAAWVHYGTTLKTLQDGLAGLDSLKSGEISPLCFATTFLTMIEALRGGAGSSALFHVRGTRQLLMKALQLPTVELDDDTRTFLVECYAYNAVLSNVSLGSDSDSWILEDATLLFPLIRNSQSETSGMFCGSATDLFQLIPRVSILARKRQADQDAQGSASWNTVSTYLALRNKIRLWTSSSDDKHLTSGGKLYQQALLVFLEMSYGKYDWMPETPPSVDDAFVEVSEIFKSLPVNLPISTTMCWPLTILGVCARNSSQREMIKQRLTDMYDFLKLGNIRDTVKLLDIIWTDPKYENTTPIDLEGIMREEGLVILFM